ncbi:uncharacterized protein LOC129594115 [Paramacrobiotus metropolitanus]|uniref:uncharacterized protein LOC129594115 n=1 Tax=Paramacrobiotus metropolitanus TaxID=2943436 RepID=UPI002445BA86|nr:uncharacterized protein LOC129594115 [Paramacrobiotus metropolitanus]XP_055346663.1 uncharacterized protein LOC129594115 [Paramacrobiotus metropolitanus]
METIWVLIGLYFNICLIVLCPHQALSAVINRQDDKYPMENYAGIDVNVANDISPYQPDNRNFPLFTDEQSVQPTDDLSPVAAIDAPTPEVAEEPVFTSYNLLAASSMGKRSPQPAEESGLTLSIMSPLDVLRDKMKQQMALRRLMQKSRTASDNAKLMKEFG